MLEAAAPAFTSARVSCYKLCGLKLKPSGWEVEGVGGVERPLKRPEEVILRRDEGKGLRARLEREAVTAEDRRVLAKVLTGYFWLLFALREAKLSLKRLKILVFGEKGTKRAPPASGGAAGGGSEPSGTGTTASPAVPPAPGQGAAEVSERRPGQGRQSAAVYWEAERVECRDEELAGGERCPACGRGGLDRLPPGSERRLAGHGLRAAVR